MDGLVYGALQAVFIPTIRITAIVIPRNEASALYFWKPRFEVLLYKLIEMIPVDVNPVEVIVGELRTARDGGSAMNFHAFRFEALTH